MYSAEAVTARATAILIHNSSGEATITPVIVGPAISAIVLMLQAVPAVVKEGNGSTGELVSE